MIDDDTLKPLAQQGSWRFDCDYHDRADSVVHHGDGVDDLDQMLDIIDRNPKMTFTLDTGKLFSAYTPAVRADVVRLRELYVGYWGETETPPVWDPQGWSTNPVN